MDWQWFDKLKFIYRRLGPGRCIQQKPRLGQRRTPPPLHITSSIYMAYYLFAVVTTGGEVCMWPFHLIHASKTWVGSEQVVGGGVGEWQP